MRVTSQVLETLESLGVLQKASQACLRAPEAILLEEMATSRGLIQVGAAMHTVTAVRMGKAEAAGTGMETAVGTGAPRAVATERAMAVGTGQAMAAGMRL